MSASVRVCLWILVALALAAVLLVGLGNDTISGALEDLGLRNPRYSDAEDFAAGDAYISPAGVRGVEIDWTAGSVDVRVYDGDEFLLRETAGRPLGEDETLRYRVSGGKLTIQYSEKRYAFLPVNLPDKKLELLIPASVALEELSVDVISARATLSGGGAALDTLRVNSISGESRVSGFSAETLRADTISGAMSVEGAFDQVNVGSVSGGLTLRLDRLPTSLRADSISGGIHVTLPENSGFTATLSSISGRLSTGFDVAADGDRVTYKDGGPALRFDTVSGSVFIGKGAASDLRVVTQSAPEPPPMELPDSPAVPEEIGASGGRSF